MWKDKKSFIFLLMLNVVVAPFLWDTFYVMFVCSFPSYFFLPYFQAIFCCGTESGWMNTMHFLSILSTVAKKILSLNRLMPVAVSELICFRWLISWRWQFREWNFLGFRCTFLPWLMQQKQRKHELYEKMHTIIVFASFFSYKNFIYTWNHSFISFLRFFLLLFKQ